MHAALPHLAAPVGGYALLGMGGMLAGVTRAPLLAVIMIFELTQNTAVLLPMMVVSVLAVAAARRSRRTRSTSASLRSAGIVWEKTPEATALASLKVSDIMRRDVALIPRDDAAAGDRRRRSCARGASSSTSATRRAGSLGVVDIHDIKESFPERELSSLVIAADLVTEIPFVDAGGAADDASTRSSGSATSGSCRSCDSATTASSSASSRSATCSARSTARSCGATASSTRVRTFGEEVGEVDFLELPENHRLIEVDVPARLEGLTIAEAGLRARYGVSVLAVKRMGRDGVERRFVPGPPTASSTATSLVVLGTEDAIARLHDDRALPVPTPS